MKKIAIFDMDGTLVQTHLYSPTCNKAALAKFGITDVKDEDIVASIGHPFRDYISVFLPDFPDEKVAEYLKVLIEVDHEYIPKLAKLFDGVADSLQKLRAEGWTTVICTNSDRKYLNLVDSAVKVSELMDDIFTLDGRPNKTATLEHICNTYPQHKAVMIGDTLFDKEAADNCGMAFVGCQYGYDKENMTKVCKDNLAQTGYDLYRLITEAI